MNLLKSTAYKTRYVQFTNMWIHKGLDQSVNIAITNVFAGDEAAFDERQAVTASYQLKFNARECRALAVKLRRYSTLRRRPLV